LGLNPNLRLSSLDLTAYAYLKEMQVNGDDTAELELLSAKNYPKLARFIAIMDLVFSNGRLEALRVNRIECKALDRPAVERLVNSYL
jgi:hypothetical protein